RGQLAIRGNREAGAASRPRRLPARGGIEPERDDLASPRAGDRPPPAAPHRPPAHVIAEAAGVRNEPAIPPPDPARPSLPAGDPPQPVRGERDGMQSSGRRTEGGLRATGVGVPEFDLAAAGDAEGTADAGHEPAIRRPPDGDHDSFVPDHRAEELSVGY